MEPLEIELEVGETLILGSHKLTLLDIDDEQVAVKLESPDDALLLNIVTLRRGARATVNLKGPIVINRFSLTGKQVVLANAADYSVQHPLPTINDED